MFRLCLLLILALGLVTAGVVSAQQPSSPREAIEKGKEAGVERAREMASELKAVRGEIAAQVGELRGLVEKKYEEAGTRAETYAIWAAVGLFALMVLASVLGGVIVALLFRRRAT